MRYKRYFGEAEYKDDGMALFLHPDTGVLRILGGVRWLTPPPPVVDIVISQNDAMWLGEAHLLSLDKEVAGVNKMQLMVVQPWSEGKPYPVLPHYGEPSRLAWVVTYSRGGPIGPGHVEEAWIDVEEGTFLGYVSCK